ncbi:hypothetical protein [Sansalvadorimonas verongulae]|uniref:hypothetical protein n=1 Tax=Sansalvadorimonas verongulae TaxID=2172824 RepID=UPI0012BC3B5A|nr:hypothetical protein [Sansalvadorimonas verongulae]MTI12405.1 hypothetical protein [Sansalvadorimonas verongulae]
MSQVADRPVAIQQWHKIIQTRNPAILGDLLADDVVFYSPVVHTPQKGKSLTRMYLMGASHVLLAGPFKVMLRPLKAINTVHKKWVRC